MQVSWCVELEVKPGQLANFVRLTNEMVTSTRDESGVLAYERFISSDQRTVIVHERYEDSDAAVAHLEKFTVTFGERYASMVERKRFMVFGQPCNELRALLDQYGAAYYEPLGGFAHWA